MSARLRADRLETPLCEAAFCYLDGFEPAQKEHAERMPRYKSIALLLDPKHESHAAFLADLRDRFERTKEDMRPQIDALRERLGKNGRQPVEYLGFVPHLADTGAGGKAPDGKFLMKVRRAVSDPNSDVVVRGADGEEFAPGDARVGSGSMVRVGLDCEPFVGSKGYGLMLVLREVELVRRVWRDRARPPVREIDGR